MINDFDCHRGARTFPMYHFRLVNFTATKSPLDGLTALWASGGAEGFPESMGRTSEAKRWSS